MTKTMKKKMEAAAKKLAGSQSKTKVPGPKKASKKGQKPNGITRVSAPAACSEIRTTGKPRFDRVGEDIIVRHRELVASIPGSLGFQTLNWTINPALPPGGPSVSAPPITTASIFTWLFKMAQLYECYEGEFNIRYVPSCGTNRDGAVFMSYDYDCLDNVPTSQAQMESYCGATRNPVWQENVLRFRREMLRKLYIRTGDVSNTDRKTYDAAVLTIATANCASTAAVGDIYVEYAVKLINPQYNSPLTGVNNDTLYSSTGSLTGTAVDPMTGATVSAGTNMTTALVTQGVAIQMPVGKYGVRMDIYSGTSSRPFIPTAYTGNLYDISAFGGAVVSSTQNFVGYGQCALPSGNGLQAQTYAYLNVTSPGTIIIKFAAAFMTAFGASLVPAQPLGANIIVSGLPPLALKHVTFQPEVKCPPPDEGWVKTMA